MSDQEFVSTDNQAEQGDLVDYETNIDVAKEDESAAKSEETGEVSQGMPITLQLLITSQLELTRD